MKIIFVASNYYPHIGGVEKHVYEISREMANDGHSITIFVEKDNKSYSDYEKHGLTEIIRLKKGCTRFIKSLTFYKQIVKNIPKLIVADVIHFHDFSTFWKWLPIILSLKLFQKKTFITFHGWEGIFPPEKTTILKRKLCEKLALGNICVGEYIEKWYGTKPDFVTYGAVRTGALNAPKEDLALFIGRLEPDTSIRQYLDAWKNISKDHPSFKLSICGDGSLKDTLLKQVISEQIQNVNFEGFVSNTESYLARAKIVFTSGYLGILEAFSFKNAVISTYDNELKRDYLEMMPDSNFMMWIPKNSDEIKICFDQALLETIRQENGYRYALENDWGGIKDMYYKLWKK